MRVKSVLTAKSRVNAKSLHARQYTTRIASTAVDVMIFAVSSRKIYVPDMILRHMFAIAVKRNQDVHCPNTCMMPKKCTKSIGKSSRNPEGISTMR